MAIEIKPIGLTIGIPTRGKKVGFEWAVNFALQNYPMNVERLMCIKLCKGGYGRGVGNNGTKETTVDEGRNLIVKTAIEQKSKYIFFWDDDVAPPPNASRLLMYDLEQDDDLAIAGGVYCSKETPAAPMVFQDDGCGSFWKWKAGDRFEVKSLGTGCMMIRTEIFKTLPEPWFLTLDMDQPPEGHTMLRVSDDMFFCKRVREAGFKLLCDSNVMCVHWDYDTDPPTPYYLAADSYPMKDAAVRMAFYKQGETNMEMAR